MSRSVSIVLALACITAIASTPQGYYEYHPDSNGAAELSTPIRLYPSKEALTGSRARGGRLLKDAEDFGNQIVEQIPSLFSGSAPSKQSNLNAFPGIAVHDSPPKKYNTLTPPVLKFRIAVISDLDQASVEELTGEEAKKGGKWFALLNEGYLQVQQNQDPEKSNITIEWNEDRIHKVESGYSYSDRGMELSTLNVFNDHIYSCDDKTGIVFELPLSDSLGVVPIPWTILADGNFTGPRGFKCEWATIKDNDLWVGGHGTDFVGKDGAIISMGEKFVKRITPKGEVTHLDWSKNFEKMAEVLEIHFPGYVTHEAAGWSEILKKWIFMPRKISQEKFTDSVDEKKGSNVILLADENFGNVQVGHIGDLIPTHGFASFKFVPGTDDQIVVAIKSVEADDKTESYIMAFDLKGNILLPETKFADQKYEGVEFI